MNDWSVVLHLRNEVQYFRSFVQSLFMVKGSRKIELVIADGCSTDIDYGKVDEECRKQGMAVSIVRANLADKWSAGYESALGQTDGVNVLFADPRLLLPPDFFAVMDDVCAKRYIVLPRAWRSLNGRPDLGAWENAGFRTLVGRRDMLCDDVSHWAVTGWTRADGIMKMGGLVKEHGYDIRIVTMSGLESSEPFQRTEAFSRYAGRISTMDFYPLTDWVHEHDVRRLRDGKSEGVGVPIPPLPDGFLNSGAFVELRARVDKAIRGIVSQCMGDGSKPVVTGDVETKVFSYFKKMYDENELPFIPRIEVTADVGGSKGSTLHIRNTGEIILPYEV